ncbi:alpha/beta hydrolase [Amycolatopsis cihanbeyliensis]|uniref:alpha/beta hydrolase n=1 Tax=Amycolatopsis cihanbeyliensis TaxID=1128664 RepID=UPI001151C014|nr:alpha/beta hydrolase [Amycolatopsis cihanbeyliensis]
MSEQKVTRFNRRMLGRAGAVAALGAGTAAAGGIARAEPAGAGRCRTFVFVPGAFARAAMFGYLVNSLAARGHRALAVELPGHEPGSAPYGPGFQAPQDLAAWAAVPSPLAGVDLRQYVRHTVGVVRGAARHGRVVLVGASTGGLVIGLVAQAVPHLVERIVYDDAFCCVRLPSIGEYYRTPEAEGAHNEFLARAVVGDPVRLGALRVNWRSADPEFLAEARAALLTPDAPDRELFDVLNILYPDDPLGLNQADARPDPRRWGRIRRTFVRHTRDGLVPIALQDRMIREADELTPGNRFDVRSVVTGHTPAADKLPEVVDILDDLP